MNTNTNMVIPAVGRRRLRQLFSGTSTRLKKVEWLPKK
jgi:hypothetical protein